jgi:hypothetical protein
MRMFLILEGEDAVILERVVALVREERETAILYRDGSVRATGFTPLTLAARTERMMRSGRTERETLFGRLFDTAPIRRNPEGNQGKDMTEGERA